MKLFRGIYTKGAVIFFLLLSLAAPRGATAYSLLTHELLIDILWQSDIVPLLKSRFPTTSDADIKSARAYVYAGALMQDSGYYAKKDEDFSDFTHYIRPGDFVANLFRNATDVDELAFAVGAMTHYVGDTIGHSSATNVAVAKIHRDIQPDALVITYAQDPSAHYQVELGFDIEAIRDGSFSPDQFRTPLGFDVALRQLTLAFYQTYGIDEDFTYKGSMLNLKNFRSVGHGWAPSAEYAIAAGNASTCKTASPTSDAVQRLTKRLQIVAQGENWSTVSRRPGAKVTLLKPIVGLSPSKSHFDCVTSETQNLYAVSVLDSVDKLDTSFKAFTDDKTASVPMYTTATSPDPKHPIQNLNLDTGNIEAPGAYSLTDVAYFHLMRDLLRDVDVDRKRYKLAWVIPPSVQDDIHDYFKQQSRSFAVPKDQPHARADLSKNLALIGGLRTTTGCPRLNFGDGDVSTSTVRYVPEKCVSLPSQP